MSRPNGFRLGTHNRRRRGAGRGARWLKLAAAALAIAALAIAALATLGYMLINLGRQLLLSGAATLADVVGETTVTVGDDPLPTFDIQAAYEADQSSPATPTPEPDDQSEVPVDALPEDMQPLTPAELQEYRRQAG
ncbi:MAG: hypothetical protein GX558_03345 [Clostridiales bacterium]|nr:hypothetical protein [Clostridiales bacterium]